MQKEQSFNWGLLILGILFIIISVFAFRNPTASILTVVYLFGFGALFKGIYEIFIHRRVKNMDAYSNGLLILGIIDIILGLIILFNIFGGIIALPYIFGIWFIIDSIGTLATAGALRQVSTGRYWLAIIFGILGIIVGIALFMNPITAYAVISLLVGFYFLITGIGYIVEAF